jgi:hypothetical protein
MRDHEVDVAVRDLEERTLASLHGGLARLVYLASTRDYNTGQYQHEGLARTYTLDAAQQALRRCHGAVFRSLVFTGLAQLLDEIRAYVQSSSGPNQVVDAWRRLEAYRVLVPAECEGLAGELFVSNIRIALEVLHSGPRQRC